MGSLWTHMKTLARRPWLLILNILAIVGMPLCFFPIVGFFAAVSPQQASQKGYPPLPPGWTAGVMNHGSYYRWWPIQERPILFAISLGGLIVCRLVVWGSLYWAWRQRQRSQA